MVVKKMRWYTGVLVGVSLVLASSISSGFAGYEAQQCVTNTIMTQIDLSDKPNESEAVLSVMKEIADRCGWIFSIMGALLLGISSVAAAILGAIFSNRLLVGPSTNVSAHYDRSSKPDTSKLVLRFDRPVIAQNPQRMVLLYRYANGMAAAVPGQQCGGSGHTPAFTANTEGLPTRMELVICPDAMHPVGFPESDVCINGRPIHVDVDILRCDT